MDTANPDKVSANVFYIICLSVGAFTFFSYVFAFN